VLQRIDVVTPRGVAPLPVRQRRSRNLARPRGQIWTIDTASIRAIASVPGCYIWHVSLGGKRVARYIGVGTTSIYDRISTYWRDMSPQLVERHPKRAKRAHTIKNVPRHEKKDLRWIHLWLAWAALAKGASVELEILPCTPHTSPRTQEKGLIGATPTTGIVSLNKEHLPRPNSVCTAYRSHNNWSVTPPLDSTGRRYLQLPVPPDWSRSRHGWLTAIDLYVTERRSAGHTC
jgi:hypothetical protein